MPSGPFTDSSGGGSGGSGGAVDSVNGHTGVVILTASDVSAQASDADLTAIAGLTSAADKLPYFTGSHTAALADFTSFGRSLVDDANASTARTTLGLGTAATSASTAFQAADAELTAIAGLTSAADTLPYFTGSGTGALTSFTSTARSLLDDTSTSAMRTTLGLAIGTDVQAQDAELSALAGVTSAADKLFYFTGSGTGTVTDLTSFARTLIDDTTQGAMQTTLGLVPGTNVQGFDAELAAIAGLTSAADRLPYFTGSGTASLATFTAAGRTLVAGADAVAQAITLNGTTLTTGTLSSDQNTIASATSYHRVRLVLGANININSLPTGTDGQVIELINTSTSNTATVTHASGSGTDKLFNLPDGINLPIRPYATAVFEYDSTNTIWRQRAAPNIGRSSRITFFAGGAVSTSITNAQVEFQNSTRRATFDLTGYNQFYLNEAHTTGTNSGTKYSVQYSLDSGSTWVWLDGTASASSPTSYVDITSAQFNAAGPFTIHSAAKAYVLLRGIFLDGGATNYNIASYHLIVV